MERFAAQLVYDTTLAQILRNGFQDSEFLREVLSQGTEEMTSIVFGPLQNARSGHSRALSQIAALQEALDEADRELMRMREEAEIVSIHAASTRAMMTLVGRNPPVQVQQHKVPAMVKNVDIGATQCDLEKEFKLAALEAQLAHDLAACEKQVRAITLWFCHPPALLPLSHTMLAFLSC